MPAHLDIIPNGSKEETTRSLFLLMAIKQNSAGDVLSGISKHIMVNANEGIE